MRYFIQVIIMQIKEPQSEMINNVISFAFGIQIYEYLNEELIIISVMEGIRTSETLTFVSSVNILLQNLR